MYLPPDAADDPRIRALIATGKAQLHFAQFGEDGVLWHHLQDEPPGFYVDVGCHHALRFSNTALLHLFRGWRGLNIDVDPDLVAALDRDRPGDVNVCAAVGARAEAREITFFEEAAVNSLDPHLVGRFRRHHKIRHVTTTPVMPLADLIRAHVPEGTAIGLLSVDVEGLDQEVLESNDWAAHAPRFVAVEAHGFDLARAAEHPTFRLLAGHGYRLLSHCVATSIYRRT